MSLSPSANYTGASYLGNIKENWLFQLFNQDSYLSLDGDDDYIDLGETTSSSSIAVTSSTGITIAAWVNFPTLGATEPIFRSHDHATNYVGYGFSKTTANKIQIDWYDGSGSGSGDRRSMYGDTVLAANTWYFVVITSTFAQATSGTKIYINGATSDSITASGTSAITTPNYSGSSLKGIIGQKLPSTDIWGEFKLKNLAIWNTRLDATNTNPITAIYNSGNFLSLEEDSGNYTQSSSLVGYWEFNNGENFAQDLSDNIATGTITGAKYGGFLPLAIRDTTVDSVFYHGVVKSSPSIRHSLDLLKSKSKTGNVSVNLINSKYQGDDLSAELFLGSNSYYNRTVKVYSQLNEMSNISNCLQLYHGRLTDISHDDSSVKLSVAQKLPWDFISIPQTKSSDKNLYFPIAYGNFTPNSTGNDYNANKTLRPMPVNEFRGIELYSLIGIEDVTTNAYPHYYDKGLNRFIPVSEDGSYNFDTNADSYKGGFAVKAHYELEKRVKFKPVETTSSTGWTNPDNAFDDDDADETTNYASADFTKTNSGTSTATIKFKMPQLEGKVTAVSIEIAYVTTRIVVISSGTPTITFSLTNKTWGVDDTFFTVEITSTGTTSSSIATDTSAALLTQFNAENGWADEIEIEAKVVCAGAGAYTGQFQPRINDVRINATTKVDWDEATNKARQSANKIVSDVNTLYTGGDGLTASWDGGAITLGHEAHRDLLIRFAGMPTIEPENWAALELDRSTWTIRSWQNEEISLADYLEILQYEFGFIHKIDPAGKSKYIWIHGTAGNNVFQAADVDVTLSKNDISSLQISTSQVSQILTKAVINTQKHPAENIYLTETTSTNSTPRATYNIKSKENTETINLDALTLAPATSPATDKQADFFSYYSQANGDVKKIIECEIVNIQKGYLLETGDIVQFSPTAGEMPVDPFADNWADYYMVTDLVRSPGKVKIKVREVG